MCKFFSLVSKGDGVAMYFDYKIRKQILSGKLNYELDSHTSIADYFGYKAEKEDKLNKYEYNPLTKIFEVDQLNTTDDSEKIKKFCLELDFKLIVPELIIKPIIYPFKDIQTTEVTKADLALLKKWASVWDSVGDSVRASVGDSVWDSVWDSVGDSVGASVWASVWDSVGASVGASVWASVGDSVGDSVGASVRAYYGSFIDIKYKYNLKPAQELWERGLVPAYNSKDKIWYLCGKDGKIVWQGKKEDIKKEDI